MSQDRHLPSFYILNVPTLRGLVLTGFVGFLIWRPVYQEQDVVASVISFSLLAIIVSATILTVLQGAILFRKLAVDLVFPQQGPDGRYRAGVSYRFGIHASGASVLPFFNVTSLPRFVHDGIAVSSVEVQFDRTGAKSFHDIIFPHRGRWAIDSVAITISDRFGFSRFRWFISGTHLPSLGVLPNAPTGSEDTLPIISSRNRQGDQVIDNRNRFGDPYDLKAYHPSDGLKKVVWKLFAKSGELYSRYPEASMTPEGEVVLFILANQTEDHVAGSALHYLERLEALGLELMIGCQGMGVHAPVSSSEEAKELLIDTAWDSAFSDPLSDAQKFLHHLNSSGELAQVVVFLSRSQVDNPSQQATIVRLLDDMDNQGIRPVCFLIEDSDMPERVENSLIATWLFGSNGEFPVKIQEHNEDFLRLCLAHNWQIEIIP